MEKNVDVAIIGAGSAGLFALREVKKVTQSYVLIDPGPFGTTCARTGCMPSKVLLQIANNYHARHKFSKTGVKNADQLVIDPVQVFSYVREMRDHYVGYLLKQIEENRGQLIEEYAEFLSPNLLKAGNHLIHAKKIIIATGSSPVILPGWKDLGPNLLTTDNFFELKSFPKRLAVLGLGAVGAELGQAMARLGVSVSAFSSSPDIGGLSDPVLQKIAKELFSLEFSVALGTEAKLEKSKDQIIVTSDTGRTDVDTVLASIGRKPNLVKLSLQNTGAQLDKKGTPLFNPKTMQLKDLPIFIAGDADADRSVLPEATDEGRIAGFNSVREAVCFERRTSLRIAFTSPNIAVVGASFKELQNREISIGEVSFNDQGRAVLEQENRGHLRIYADPNSGLLLGAEMIAPSGEHLAHFLALAIQRRLTVFELLQAPFYHPVLEQGIKTALRDLSKKVKNKPSELELVLCGERDDLY